MHASIGWSREGQQHVQLRLRGIRPKDRLTDDRGESLDLEAVHGNDVGLRGKKREKLSSSSTHRLGGSLGAVGDGADELTVEEQSQYTRSKRAFPNLRRVVGNENSDTEGSAAEESKEQRSASRFCDTCRTLT
jgi:hypothetical protein